MPADTPRHVKPYIVVFAFWISEYMAIAVESVEMGGGGVVHVTISNLEFMYIDQHLICDVNILKLGN